MHFLTVTYIPEAARIGGIRRNVVIIVRDGPWGRRRPGRGGCGSGLRASGRVGDAQDLPGFGHGVPELGMAARMLDEIEEVAAVSGGRVLPVPNPPAGQVHIEGLARVVVDVAGLPVVAGLPAGRKV